MDKVLIEQTITAISVVGNLLLGYIVLVRDKKSATNILFFIFALISALSSIANYFSLHSASEASTLFWIRMVMFFASYLAVAFYLFVDTFPKQKLSISHFWLYIVVSLGIINSIIAISPLLFSSVSVSYANIQPSPGLGMAFYMPTFIILLVGGLYLLIRNYKREQGDLKNQLKLLLWGLALTFIFIVLINVIFVNIFKVSSLQFLAGLFTLIYVSFTAYAILKYRLFNIKIILTEAAVVIINVVLTVQIITANTIVEGLLRFLFEILVFYGSYLLVKSVLREIKFRQELQQMAEQLAHANAHLKELDKMKTEFVSLASHELLTPVSAIEGYLSMMLDEHLAKVDDPKAVHYMDRVYNSAKRLARLVTDMLNVSRIEEGRLLVEKREVSLTGLIQQVIDEIKFKAEEKKQKIKFDSTNHWITWGDPDKIKEVLINLIGNSIKYSKNPGEIDVSIEIVPTQQVQETWNGIESSIKAGPLDDQEAIKSAVDERLKRLVGEKQILIHVKDQGIGIPKEELPRLFKKFHRVGDYTTAESQGTGLGLYISRALVELHHGRIWADSEGSGKGSTFTFSLPQVNVQKDIIDLEKQVPKTKEALKPLARPTKEAEEL